MKKLSEGGSERLITDLQVTRGGVTVNNVTDILRGDINGTIFRPRGDRMDHRKRWIAFGRAKSGALILDDGGRFPTHSAPKFEDFQHVVPAKAIGNHSLLFMRREQSWHGVKEIRCPPDALRKVFIVVIEDWGLKARLRSLFNNKKKY